MKEGKTQNEVIRPIDGNALLEKMQHRLPVEDDISDAVSNCAGIARKLVERMPTLDVVPVVRGRWDIDKSFIPFVCTCSKCSASYDTDGAFEWNYCPNCGAKMDGDGDGN